MVAGTMTAKSADALWIDNQSFSLNSNSIVLDQNYSPVDVNTYKSGEIITVWAKNNNGGNELLQSKLGVSSITTSIAGDVSRVNAPELFELQANYPNPFNPETTIPFRINSSGFSKVQLDVFDITGRKVRTLFNGLLDTGSYTFKWDGRNEIGNAVASGIYLYRLGVADQFQTGKMALIR